MTAICAKPPPVTVSPYCGSNARTVEELTGIAEIDREADAKQEGGKVGSACVWTTHAGIKRGGRTHTDRVLLTEEHRWDGVRYAYIITNIFLYTWKIGKYGIKLANSRTGCGISR